MQVQIDAQTRTVLAVGTFPTPPDDPGILVRDLDEADLDALTLPGTKALSAAGRLIVTPPPPPAPPPPDTTAADVQAVLALAAGNPDAQAALERLLLRALGQPIAP